MFDFYEKNPQVGKEIKFQLEENTFIDPDSEDSLIFNIYYYNETLDFW